MITRNDTLHRSRRIITALARCLLLWLALPACGDNKEPLVDPALTVVSASAAPRVAPGAALTVSVTLTNSGAVIWPADLRLELQANPDWNAPVWELPDAVSPGDTVTVTQTIDASTQIGFHTLTWSAVGPAGPLGAEATIALEVTCDDGVFCNGDERYVNGACTAATSPCDDGAACTTDQCDEERELCTFVLAADCYTCDRAECDPVCTGKECGDDGCGGSCCACGVGALCIGGACTTDAPPGTCLSPIALLAPDAALLGTHVITGDTSTGFHSVSPTCNTVSDARELVYTFTIDRVVGIDARMAGYDTVIDLRRGDCVDTAASVACSDDATPPGDYGSRVPDRPARVSGPRASSCLFPRLP